MKVASFDMPLEEIRRSLEPLRRPLRIAVLRSNNPFNVGAIIRTAHSFLVKEIVLVGNEPWYERAAMGMQRYESIVQLPTEADLVAWARERGLHIAVFEREHAKVDLWRAALPENCLLVFGSENHGVPDETGQGRRRGGRHPDVRHQQLVPGDRGRGHRDGGMDPTPLRWCLTGGTCAQDKKGARRPLFSRTSGA